MKINRRGITRIVLEFKRFIIKIPNPTCSWQHFLKGLIANIHENQTWKYTRSDLLCPVIWASWGGWILIMKKADVERHMQEMNDLLKQGKEPMWYIAWKEAGFEGDDKSSNYGYLNEKIVKVDYGQ